MTAYQPEYAWLLAEPAPKMLLQALALWGTKEKTGSADNPVILGWAKEIGQAGYTADSIPWCGLFVGVIAKRAGKPLPASPLWARDWATWGERSPDPALGDVLVFERPGGGGHVGLYVGEDASAFHVLGGNQSDSVRISRVGKDRLISARRYYAIGVPPNVRKIRLAIAGGLSTNEA